VLRTNVAAVIDKDFHVGEEVSKVPRHVQTALALEHSRSWPRAYSIQSLQCQVSRAYSVRAGNDPTAAKQFSDMGVAESYFEELIIGRLNPRR
jgi:hypothetical protein